MRKVELPQNAKAQVIWNVSPYDYTPEKKNQICAKFADKYGIDKNRVKVIANIKTIDDNGQEISISKDIISKIQDVEFQQTLFKDYIAERKITDCDFDQIKKIDAEINVNINYDVYDKYRRYSIKWVKWDNFLSYGKNNFFDFTTLDGLVLLNGAPANQTGKTTFAIDLIHYLLFGKCSNGKADVNSKIFNKHIPESTSVKVEGCINIEGVDYVIRRTLSRPALEKRTAKSKITSTLEYFKVIGDNDYESLKDVDSDTADESLNEASVQDTNKVIKEALGRESDFDLIICATAKNLDELIDKKDTERGKLLSRWIGLDVIEEKSILAKDKYNKVIKPSLISNHYDRQSLALDIDNCKINIDNIKNSITDKNSMIDNQQNELVALKEQRDNLLSAKSQIDADLLKYDRYTLENSLQKIKEKGSMWHKQIDDTNTQIAEIGTVSFNAEDYDKKVGELSECNILINTIRNEYRNVDSQMKSLKNGEFCPTCHQRLVGVDNSEHIKECENKLEELKQQGIQTANNKTVLEQAVSEMKKSRDLYDMLNKLVVKKSSLEVEYEKCLSLYKETKTTYDKYLSNASLIDNNNKIDREIIVKDGLIRTHEEGIENLKHEVINLSNQIENINNQIVNDTNLIETIAKEAIIEKHWKIYMDMVGKDGVSKMVLRKAIPNINAKLNERLNNVCDFEIEVAISDKNDVMFYLVKDGVKSDLTSGSGFERTASALALRSVLGEMSTMPRPDFLVVDEVLDGVSAENYSKIETLFNKILSDYKFIIHVTHIEEVKDWHSQIITVNKTGNISTISTINN